MRYPDPTPSDAVKLSLPHAFGWDSTDGLIDEAMPQNLTDRGLCHQG